MLVFVKYQKMKCFYQFIKLKSFNSVPEAIHQHSSQEINADINLIDTFSDYDRLADFEFIVKLKFIDYFMKYCR